MKNSTHSNENALDSSLSSIVNRLEQRDFDEAKKSFNALASQKNAYTCESPEAKWNMITYKKGKKSAL